MSNECCKHAHVGYLESNHSVDKDFLVEHFGECAFAERRKEVHPYNNKLQISVVYITNEKETVKLCTCECHLRGSGMYVLH